MDETHHQHQPLQELPPAVVKVRWKPNDEQLRMLVRLFEDEGDSINKQRIKEIAVDLARQGDVTEANVHNWFHNRKARAKRKQKLMQQNDGESEVDTDDVDSKGKRSKLEHHHHHHHAAIASKVTNSSPSAPPNGTLFLPEFAQPEPQQGFMAGFPMRQPLRLPSDAVNLNSRMYESSLMITPHHHHQNLAPPPPPPASHHHHHHHHQAAAHGVIDKFRVAPYASQEIPPPETHMIDWRPHHQLALMPTQAGTDLQDRSSESKTITDDASTESEDISDSRAWSSKPQPVKKSWKKRAKGTMIRKPLAAAAAAVASAGNGRASRNHHSSSTTRKRRIREIIKGLKRSNPESYERDLKALFVEVVRRIGGNKARSILNRLTRPDSDTSTSSSSGSQAMDSGSCSSTASLPRQARRVSSSSPSDYNTGTNNVSVRGGDHFYSDPYGRLATTTTTATTTTALPTANEQASFYHQNPSSYDQHHHQHHQSSVSMWDPSARHELTLSSSSKQYQQQQKVFQQQGTQEQQQPGFRGSKSSSSTEDDDDDDEDTNDANNGDETDGDNKEEFRIVWKKQQQQETFTSAAIPQSFESRCEEATPSTPAVAPVAAAAPAKKEKPSKQQQQQQQQQRLEVAPEGEKTNVTLIDGKPSGTTGTWWNSVLRHSALLFLDVSIPHIALQPEEGMVRIRDYMDSKFTYVGGTLDDAFLKKQVAKALNFRRHKVMRMIEQGSSRPSDVSQEQWDSLIKYYADPKRREKSDKQRAALKALNMNNQQQQQQQQQFQQQVQVQQQQLQQQQQQIQSPHAPLNLNMSIHTQSSQEQDDVRLNLPGEEAEDEDDDGEDDDEEDTEDEQVAPPAP